MTHINRILSELVLMRMRIDRAPSPNNHLWIIYTT